MFSSLTSHRFLMPVGISGRSCSRVCINPTRVPAGVRASRDSHLDQIDQAVHAGTEPCAPASQLCSSGSCLHIVQYYYCTSAHLTPNYPPKAVPQATMINHDTRQKPLCPFAKSKMFCLLFSPWIAGSAMDRRSVKRGDGERDDVLAASDVVREGEKTEKFAVSVGPARQRGTGPDTGLWFLAPVALGPAAAADQDQPLPPQGKRRDCSTTSGPCP